MINVDRSVVAPPAIGDNWRTEQILESLGIVFLNKCYLCENLSANPQDFEVDHFLTRAERNDLTLQWENLYLICENCNRMKPKSTPLGGYLDPCNSNENVESEIGYILNVNDYDNPIFVCGNPSPSRKAINTANLLMRLHHGSNPNTRRKTASLRNAIEKQASKLITAIANHQKARNDRNHITERENLQYIGQYLSRNSPFTMLMRVIGERYGYESEFD